MALYSSTYVSELRLSAVSCHDTDVQRKINILESIVLPLHSVITIFTTIPRVLWGKPHSHRPPPQSVDAHTLLHRTPTPKVGKKEKQLSSVSVTHEERYCRGVEHSPVKSSYLKIHHIDINSLSTRLCAVLKITLSSKDRTITNHTDMCATYINWIRCDLGFPRLLLGEITILLAS